MNTIESNTEKNPKKQTKIQSFQKMKFCLLCALFLFASVNAQNAPKEYGFLTEFSFKNHWFLKSKKWDSDYFIHHPDCPCKKNISNQQEEKNEKTFTTM